MKSSITLTLGVCTAFLLVFTSCDNESDTVDSPIAASQELEIAQNEAETESLYEDVDDLSSVAFNNEVASNGRVQEDARFLCADIVRDTASQTITITFPEEGCPGPGGRVRRGTIIVDYDGSRFRPGSTITWTLQNFSVNGVQIEGTRTLENLNASTDEAPMHRITISDARISYLNGDVATRNANRVRTWERALNPLNDQIIMSASEGSEFSAEGITRRGIEYRVIIIEPIVYQRGCKLGPNRTFFPVSGVKQISANGRIITVDYGDGTCDTIITVTTSDGTTQEIDLSA
ncbi:MAG: hypothetical protein AAF363_09275 [Bacteroidota bacterium]